jgi:hypothetical protein
VRWAIERLFHLVKNACRIARLMRLGRGCPDLPAELFFEPDEWKGAYVLPAIGTRIARGDRDAPDLWVTGCVDRVAAITVET